MTAEQKGAPPVLPAVLSRVRRTTISYTTSTTAMDFRKIRAIPPALERSFSILITKVNFQFIGDRVTTAGFRTTESPGAAARSRRYRMTENATKEVQNNERVGWTYDLMLSIYLALVAMSMNIRSARLSWPTRLNLAYMSHRYPNSPRGLDDPYREAIAAFLMVWIFALVMFLVFRAISSSVPGRELFTRVGGFVAVTAFPLACLYSGGARFLFLELELACIVVGIALYSSGRWRIPLWMLFPLLLLHFTAWSLLAVYPPWPGLILIWPGWWKWFWSYQQYAIAVYPLLGFLCASYWALRSQIRFMQNWGKEGQTA